MRTALVLGSIAVAFFAFGILSQGIVPLSGGASHPSATGTHGTLLPTRTIATPGPVAAPSGTFGPGSNAYAAAGPSNSWPSVLPSQTTGNNGMIPMGPTMGPGHCVMHAKMASVDLSAH